MILFRFPQSLLLVKSMALFHLLCHLFYSIIQSVLSVPSRHDSMKEEEMVAAGGKWPIFFVFKSYMPITDIALEEKMATHSVILALKIPWTEELVDHGVTRSWTRLSTHISFSFSSVVQSCPTLCDPVNHSTPGLPVHHQLPEFTRLMSIESVMPSSHLILCRPLLLLPSIRVFSNESALHMRWPKYWSFSFNISPSNEHPGLISFRMDWLDLLAVQGTLKSLLQHHSSKASILLHSAFFTVQLSHPNMTTGKTIALTRRNSVDKKMSLLLNMLSRLVITFLPRNKCLLISWLQSPSAVILESPKIRPATVSTISPSICHEVMGLDAMILVF